MLSTATKRALSRTTPNPIIPYRACAHACGTDPPAQWHRSFQTTTSNEKVLSATAATLRNVTYSEQIQARQAFSDQRKARRDILAAAKIRSMKTACDFAVLASMPPETIPVPKEFIRLTAPNDLQWRMSHGIPSMVTPPATEDESATGEEVRRKGLYATYGLRKSISRGFSSMAPALSACNTSKALNTIQQQYSPMFFDEEITTVNTSAHLLDLLFSNDVQEHVGFDIPANSVLRTGVGSTPITEVDPGVWAKLEGYNHSGSIKDRAILSMVLKMFEAGTLTNGSTLTLTTSGSAGVSLALIQQALAEDCGIDLNVIIIMPKAYEQKAVAQKMVGQHQVPAFYDEADPNAKCQLLLLDGTFMEVMQEGKALAAQSGYGVLDQHFDINSMVAHKSTAIELVSQMPNVTDVVCATGTGATAAGLRTFLPSHIKVHSRASESGTIDGLSDISRYDNFCNENLLEGYRNEAFDANVAKEHQHILLDEHKLQCGMSSGATMWLARQVKQAKPDAQVAFISACGKAA